jgi:hypothetical protein
VAADLAKTAYYIAVLNPHNDLQLFAVGGDTPEHVNSSYEDFLG